MRNARATRALKHTVLTNTHKVSVFHFSSTRIEEKVWETHPEQDTQDTIHHYKAFDERDNNKTIQGKIKQVTSNSPLGVLYEVESAESAPSLVPEKPA